METLSNSHKCGKGCRLAVVITVVGKWVGH